MAAARMQKLPLLLTLLPVRWHAAVYAAARASRLTAAVSAVSGRLPSSASREVVALEQAWKWSLAGQGAAQEVAQEMTQEA